MPRGYRYVIVAAFGWLALTGQHPKPTADPKQTRAQESIANSLSNIATTNNELAERAKRPVERQPCGPGNYKSNDDLCAQWKAADAAADATWWAQWGTWLSGVSLFAVAIAIYLTIESNNIARETAKRQLRAYLAFTHTSLVTDHTLSPDGSIMFLLKNFGQTPGRSVQLRRTSRRIIGPLGDDHLQAEENPVEMVGDLQPGQELSLNLWLDELRDVWASFDDGYRVFWKIRADYETVFGQRDCGELVIVIEKEPATSQIRHSILARHHRYGGER